ncbi:MAG: hypothetical protein C4K48_12280 [Candidatus Thorarchaeota archaeon]|nr:MAG: hypothetical protein C4K48_12280 [Candidatus Thorarchaeota archaeon]
MPEDDNRAAILKAAKERAKQSEEHHIIQLLADAVGERRDRDLLDLLSHIERERGWPDTLGFLMRAQEFSYSLPVGEGVDKTKVEDLKYREMLFSLLGCRGLEPIHTSTEELLIRMKNEHSLTEASLSLREYIESVARKQIETGDTLFFSSNDLDVQISEDLSQLLERLNREAAQGLTLERKDSEVNIVPLWYCETVRQILSEYGIKGYTIDSKKLEELLTVIRYPIIISDIDQYTVVPKQVLHSSNLAYRDLHDCIIRHDGDGLCGLSSRHSFATLRFMLQDVLDIYTKDPSSENYRRVLDLIHMHVRVRTIDSLQLLEGLAFLKDDRIATVAITALGNFYHESTAYVLTELLCKSKKREIVKTAMNAVLNVGKKCPEARSVVTDALETSSCVHKGRLKRLLTELKKNSQLYY